MDLASQEKEPLRLYTEANEWINSEEYNEALPLLLNILYAGYDNANIQYKIGYCYLNIPGKKHLSVPYLQKAVKNTTKSYDPYAFSTTSAPIESLFLLGKAYRLKYYLDDAIQAYKKYLNEVSPKDSLKIASARREIIKCENAMDLSSQPIELEITNLGGIINTPFNNFNPVAVGALEEIIYMNQLKFYDAVYFSTLLGNSWSEPENLTNKIRSDGEFYLTGSSSSGHELIFSTYNMISKADLFYSRFNGNKWSKLEAFPEPVNSPFIENHGSFSPDGQALYFTSNRSGGYGGMDIYVSYLEAGNNWSQPVNLGSEINTPFDEATPFLVSRDQKEQLFFSSRGHYNMGGFDIFRSEKNMDGSWSQPKNLGYPLNTTDDEIFFHPSARGNEGYMSRYDEAGGYGKLDIFHVKLLSKPSPRKVSIKGTINRSGKWEKSVIELIENNKKERKSLGKTSLNSHGEYFFRVKEGEYIIQLQSLEDTVTTEISIPENNPHHEVINPINTGDFTVTKTDLSPEPLENKNRDTITTRYFVLFDFDSSILPAREKTKLDSLKNELTNKEFHSILVQGRSDNIGDSLYNFYLSKSRAENVQQYLSGSISSSSKTVLKFLGESSPVTKNIGETRKWNRSAEIIIYHPLTSKFITKSNQIPEKYIIR